MQIGRSLLLIPESTLPLHAKNLVSDSHPVDPDMNDGFHPLEAPIQSASGGQSTGEESLIEIFKR